MPPIIKEYYHDIDLNKNQLLNSRIQNITTAQRILLAASLNLFDKGFIVYDTDLLSSYQWDGTMWVSMSGTATSVLWSNVLATPTTLAGYGITDPVLLSTSNYADPSWLTSLDWTKLINVPLTFTPSPHTHVLGDLLQSGANINEVPQWNGTNWVAAALPASTNIYNSDGTISSDRTVTLGTNRLNFSSNGSFRSTFSGSPFSVQIADNAGWDFGITRFSNVSSPPNLVFVKTRGANANDDLSLVNNDFLMRIAAVGVSANNLLSGQESLRIFAGVYPTGGVSNFQSGAVPDTSVLPTSFNIATLGITSGLLSRFTIYPDGEIILANMGATPGATSTQIISNGYKLQVFGNASVTGNLLLNTTQGAINNSSAQFEMVSTTRGFLPPRMTAAQRIAIGTPAVGLQVYATDATEGQFVNLSTGWYRFLTTADIGTVITSTNIYNTDGTITGARTLTLGGNPLDIAGTTTTRFFANGRIGVGTTTDAGFLLDVNGTTRFSDILTLGDNLNGGNILITSIVSPAVSFSGGAGNNNVVIGRQNLSHIISNQGNVLIGDRAGQRVTGGGGNIIQGSRALENITTGSFNVGIGYLAGTPNSSGGQHTPIGDVSNKLVLGNHTGTPIFGDMSTRQVIINGSNTNIPTINSSVQFGIESTTRGFLPPTMTNAQRTAISTPAVGLVVYQTDGTEGLYENTSSGWRVINSAGGSGTVTSVGFTAGTGINIGGTNPITTSGTVTITNSAPDQIVSLTNGTAISVTGTYPNFTLTNTAPDQVVSFSTGSGISVTGTYPSFNLTNTDLGSSQNIFKNIAVNLQNTIVADSNNDTLTVAAGTGINITTDDVTDTLTITNSSPDQVVSLTAGTATTITGSYPNFTIGASYTPVNKAGDTMTGYLILNADPIAALGAATKQYVDATATTGIHIHTPVRVETTGNLTATYTQGGTTPIVTDITTTDTLTIGAHSLLVNDIIVFTSTSNGLTAGTPYFVYDAPSGTQIRLSASYGGVLLSGLTNGTGLTIGSRANSGVGAKLTNAGTQVALTLDTVPMVLGDRVMVRLQTNGFENGVYEVTNVGSGSTNWELTRATDSNKYGLNDPNTVNEGDYYFTQEGAVNAGDSHVLTTSGVIIFGVTSLTFTQFSGAITYTGGTNIDVTGQVISLTGQVAVANGGTGASTLTGTLIGNGTSAVTAVIGTAGQILRRNLSDTAYEFYTESFIERVITTISANTVAAAASNTDYVYLASGVTTVTLPTAVGNSNRYTVKNVGVNTVSVNTTLGQTIDGSSSATLAVTNTSLDFISNGTNWNVI